MNVTQLTAILAAYYYAGLKGAVITGACLALAGATMTVFEAARKAARK